MEDRKEAISDTISPAAAYEFTEKERNEGGEGRKEKRKEKEDKEREYNMTMVVYYTVQQVPYLGRPAGS